MWFVTLVFCPRSRASQKASKQSAESTGKQATISALKHLTNNPIRPPSPRRILAVYIIDMQYPRVVGAYPAAGQFLRADLATIILYSKERVGNYPAVIYSVLMFPPSFIIPISGRCSPGTTHHYGPYFWLAAPPGCRPSAKRASALSCPCFGPSGRRTAAMCRSPGSPRTRRCAGPFEQSR